MKNFFSKLIDFWNEDKSLTIMLLLLLLFIFVFVPTLSPRGGSQVFLKITYSVIVVSGILSVLQHKKYVIIICILAVIDVLIYWLSDTDSGFAILIVNDLSSILFNLFFATAILIKTFKSGDITFQRIEGSIVVYLLMGLVFAFLFHTVYLFAGESSFNNIGGADMKTFLYYSFTTLTTVGYGDISPVHPLARSLANLEALIGQLYPAILIARLVSMEFESSSRRKEKK
jgi:hypothetical protein